MRLNSRNQKKGLNKAMPVIKSKPTSPGRRFVIQVKNPDLKKGKPYKPLLEKKNKSGGRNNKGQNYNKAYWRRT